MWEKPSSRFTMKGQIWPLSVSNFQAYITFNPLEHFEKCTATVYSFQLGCSWLWPTSIANSLNNHFVSISSMHPILLPPVLTPHPQPCPCYSWSQNSVRDPWPFSYVIQLLVLTSSHLFLSKPRNPSSLVLYLTSILPSLYPPSPVPGSAAQSGLSTREAGGLVSPTTDRSPSLLLAANYWRGMCKSITEYLDSNNLLYSYQSGICSGHSTQFLLLHCTNKW